MVFLSIPFYAFVAVMVVFYYIFPLKYRWLLLLAGSLVFYYRLSGGRLLFVFLVLWTYGMGRALAVLRRMDGDGQKRMAKLCLGVAILLTVAPLLIIKNGNFVLHVFHQRERYSWAVPLGLSFFTLQMVGYLADIYLGKIEAETNPLKYALFVTFFPQMVQGPIPRFGDLQEQLLRGHPFCEKDFVKGLLLILWGFFLKLMIADKAAVVVNRVFENSAMYGGGIILTAGILYSIQLYTDFQACVCLARGVAELFGIHLTENFRHPYLSLSVKEFWQRWHMSLSFWLRDYVYIPLGGSRKGKLRRYLNLAVTFGVSGIWHGAGYKYLFWGLLHAFYQVAGEMTSPIREKIYGFLKVPGDSILRKMLRRITTFILVMVAWIIFRAESLREGARMICSMVMTYNPWIFFDDTLLRLGLGWKEWMILLASVFVLFRASLLQERFCIRDWLLDQHILFRWLSYLTAVLVILVFGTYGYGFDAQAFIYGGF